MLEAFLKRKSRPSTASSESTKEQILSALLLTSALFGMDVEWDPYRMTEGISDDPVQAAIYGMRNLHGAAETLMQWVLDDGDDYYELEANYLQFLTQWNRYAEHAAAAVGGSWTHHKRYGEEGPVYTAVEPDY